MAQPIAAGATAFFVPAGTLLQESCMLDLLSVLATVIFFLASLAYVAGCERL